MHHALAVVTLLATGCLGISPLAWSQAPAAAATVTGYEVVGNTLLPAETVDAALAPFLGRRSLAELQEAAGALQERYRRAGYGSVVVYVPEQAATDGIVRLAVLEGKMATVVVSGNQRLPPDAVRRAMPALQEGRTPNVLDLDRQIRLANENPSRQFAVTLEPGAATGEVDAQVRVTEAAVSRWSVSVDNTGDDSTGDWRAALSWRHDDVAGRDHQLAVQVQTSPTSPSDVFIATATYGVPLYAHAMRLDAYMAYSDVDGGATSTPVGRLSFAGQGNVFGARLTKLLRRWGEVDHRVSAGLDRRDYLNDCRIAGLPPGACGSAGESVTATPLTLDYTAQRDTGVPAGAYLIYSTNLGLGGSHGAQADFDAVRPGAPRRYQVWRLGAQVNPALGGDWGLRARVQAQLGDDALIPGEQFGLAGARAVRGYEEREVIGDAGVLASVELVSPSLLPRAAADTPASLRLSLFGDGGRVRNHRGTECREGQTACALIGAGLGLSYARGPGQLRLDLARAGRDGTLTDKGDWKLHLAATWTIE